MIDHPILPAGYNSWMIGGDEVDGAGVNEPVWTMFLDSFVGYAPIIVNDEMTDLFKTGCPDIVFPCENVTVVVPAVNNTYMVVQKVKELA